MSITTGIPVMKKSFLHKSFGVKISRQIWIAISTLLGYNQLGPVRSSVTNPQLHASRNSVLEAL